uniref:Uncharacterized protein n=1 Tax=Ciona savignyi TaxID=51511 RepID=H2ZB19_CIOSA
MDREQSKKLVSDHLGNGTGQEAWLIPFAVTVSLALGVVVVMIAHHFIKRFRRNSATEEERGHDGYNPATTDSDEAITFTAFRDENPDAEYNMSSQVQPAQEHNGRLVVESRRVDVHKQPSWSAAPPDYNVVTMPNLNNMPTSNL